MITIIAGTNRSNSHSFKVAQYYKGKLNEKGLEADILSLEALPHDFLFSDLYGKRSPAFQVIQDRIIATNKFLFVIPEYNGSFPGVLKSFIDGCTFPDSFLGKKAALVGISSGKYGNIRGIDHFTGVCHYLQLNVLPLKLHISYIRNELDHTGNFYKEETLKFTNVQLEEFVRF